MTREDHPDDRRSHRLLPTPAGLAAVERFEIADATVAELVFDDQSKTEMKTIGPKTGSAGVSLKAIFFANNQSASSGLSDS